MWLTRRVFAALAATLLLALVAPAAAQQPTAPEPEAALEAELDTVDELFLRGMTEFNTDQQSRSIVLFDEVISSLESLRGRPGFPDTATETLVQSYELKGRAYFNLGSSEEARDAFRTLIRLSPGYTLNPDEVSPKVIELFDGVKKSLVGYVAASSQPPGAEVKLNGEPIGLTDFFPVEVLAGSWRVEIERPGYATHTETLIVVPGETETLEVELTRVAASLHFITEPTEVEIWVDGELRATTGGVLSPDLARRAAASGLDPNRASALIEVDNLAPGTHEVEYRKNCYTTAHTVVEASEPTDYDVPPVRMEASLGTLSLRSDPPGAEIFINGEFKGFTPKELNDICSGKMQLEVKHSSGKFVQDLELGKNEELSLNCPIRPSLAFLGVVSESASGEAASEEVAERISENLSTVSTLNYITPSAAAVNRALGAEGLTLAQLIPGSGAEPDVIRRAGDRLAEALQVQGFLIAHLPEESLQRTANLHLLAAGNASSDVQPVNFRESPSYLSFISRIDRRATVYRPWTGLITVDTLLHEGVPVLRVVPDGPAAKAGVELEEVVVAADGQPIRATAELLALVAARKAEEPLSLQLRGPAGERELQLTLEDAPEEVPLHEPSLLYNKVMMDLRQQVEGYPGTETAAFARLNLAICAMHFDDFALAHEHLLAARSELPERPGISRGTALYYLGLSLERLGYPQEAMDAWRQAASYEEATLFNNDGPRVAPLAAERAGSP